MQNNHYPPSENKIEQSYLLFQKTINKMSERKFFSVEHWKDISQIPGLEEYANYKVSTFGNVFSFRTHRNMKPYITNRGYPRVDLCAKGSVKHFSVHRLVALAFISNPDNLPEVDHKNGITSDNRVDNLRWACRSSNGKNQHMAHSKTGHQGIYLTPNNTYRVCYFVNKKRIRKNLKTLEEAVEFRAEMVKLYYDRPE